MHETYKQTSVWCNACRLVIIDRFEMNGVLKGNHEGNLLQLCVTEKTTIGGQKDTRCSRLKPGALTPALPPTYFPTGKPCSCKFVSVKVPFCREVHLRREVSGARSLPRRPVRIRSCPHFPASLQPSGPPHFFIWVPKPRACTFRTSLAPGEYGALLCDPNGLLSHPASQPQTSLSGHFCIVILTKDNSMMIILFWWVAGGQKALAYRADLLASAVPSPADSPRGL